MVGRGKDAMCGRYWVQSAPIHRLSLLRKARRRGEGRLRMSMEGGRGGENWRRLAPPRSLREGTSRSVTRVRTARDALEQCAWCWHGIASEWPARIPVARVARDTQTPSASKCANAPGRKSLRRRTRDPPGGQQAFKRARTSSVSRDPHTRAESRLETRAGKKKTQAHWILRLRMQLSRTTISAWSPHRVSSICGSKLPRERNGAHAYPRRRSGC
ncbi:hypothetical protein B0H11DRAFT_2116346 [Mycena galericulata]|nr:hypothetical protein B0H11DRAFT_2116346 [Mycena galericulata]